MRALFIGGTGNISTDCASLLHQQGHEISVLSRGRNRIPSEYEAIIADRNDETALRSAFENRQFDAAINFLGFDVADLERDYKVLAGKTDQYIFISTAMVYAKPNQCPITEDHPIGNTYSDYAQKKEACERWLMERGRDEGFPFTIVRPSHTYSKKWIPNTITSKGYTAAARIEAGKPLFVPDDGRSLWTLTATTDFAVALAGLVGNEKAIGEAVHITSDEALSWNEIYMELAHAVGVDMPAPVQIPVDWICENFPEQTGGLKGDKAHSAVFDNSKIKLLVPGFECEKPFKKGIREAVAYLREHPEEQEINSDMDALFDRIIDGWNKAPA